MAIFSMQVALASSAMLLGQGIRTKSRSVWRSLVETGHIDLVGHRGASHTSPQNTLAANRVAFEQGADGVEFDVHLSADGEVFLNHDYTLKKLASKKCPKEICFDGDGGMSEADYLAKLDVQVSTLSYKNFIRYVDVGSWKGSEWADQRPSLLKDVMDQIPEDKYALCEVKGGNEDLARAVVELAATNKWSASRFHVIGFYMNAMKVVKKGFLDHGMTNKVWFIRGAPDVAEALKAVEDAHANGMDGVDFNGAPEIVTDEVAQAAKKVGLETAVYVTPRFTNIDTVKNVKYMEEIGIDVFTSDLVPEVVQYIADRGA